MQDPMPYRFSEDIALVKSLLSLSDEDLAAELDVTPKTLGSWVSGQATARSSNVSAFYDLAYRKGVRINRIKEQLYQETEDSDTSRVLFHGAKEPIVGNLSLDRSRPDNDFGKGFYCGETLRQPAMYVSDYRNSSLYVVSYGYAPDLVSVSFDVDQTWMLTIAYYRGKLAEYEGSPLVQHLIESVEGADVISAPIADNRMYQVIGDFIDGEITDVQCRHCLSATNLGRQHIFRSERALERLTLLERCYLAEQEKAAYLESQRDETSVGISKSKVARRLYRGQGLYIDQLFEEGSHA